MAAAVKSATEGVVTTVEIDVVVTDEEETFDTNDNVSKEDAHAIVVVAKMAPIGVAHKDCSKSRRLHPNSCFLII